MEGAGGGGPKGRVGRATASHVFEARRGVGLGFCSECRERSGGSVKPRASPVTAVSRPVTTAATCGVSLRSGYFHFCGRE